jgi:peptidoglycan/LPS O-acetylase OafA/YrhL
VPQQQQHQRQRTGSLAPVTPHFAQLQADPQQQQQTQEAFVRPCRRGGGGRCSSVCNGAASILLCFSLFDTLPRLAAPRPRHQPALRVLDGLRCMSICAVILGQALVLMQPVGIMNLQALLPPSGLAATPAFQALLRADFAVDTFLFLSGCLAAYVLLQRAAAASLGGAAGSLCQPRLLASFIGHRVWRILPAYAAALGCYALLWPSIGSGPFWAALQPYTERCASWWWTNLLFVNNLVPWQDNAASQCLPGSAYLALDMQLFALVPLLVGAYLLYPKAGIGLAALLAATGLLASVVITARQSLTSQLRLDGGTQLGADAYANAFLSKPYTRSPAYLLGVLLTFAWDQVLRARQAAAHAADAGAATAAVAAAAAAAGGTAAAPRQATALARALSRLLAFKARRGESSGAAVAPGSQPIAGNSTGGAVHGTVTGVAGRDTAEGHAGSRSAQQAEGHAVPYTLSLAAQTGLQSAGVGLLAAVVYGGIGAYDSASAAADPSSATFAAWAAGVSNVAFTAASRTVWAAGLWLLLFPALIQPDNPLRAVLGVGVWRVLGQLSFGAFLAHAGVLQAIYFAGTEMLRYSPLLFARDYGAALLFSFAAGLLLYAGCERPAANLELLLPACVRQRPMASAAASGAGKGRLRVSTGAAGGGSSGGFLAAAAAFVARVARCGASCCAAVLCCPCRRCRCTRSSGSSGGWAGTGSAGADRAGSGIGSPRFGSPSGLLLMGQHGGIGSLNGSLAAPVAPGGRWDEGMWSVPASHTTAASAASRGTYGLALGLQPPHAGGVPKQPLLDAGLRDRLLDS